PARAAALEEEQEVRRAGSPDEELVLRPVAADGARELHLVPDVRIPPVDQDLDDGLEQGLRARGQRNQRECDDQQTPDESPSHVLPLRSSRRGAAGARASGGYSVLRKPEAVDSGCDARRRRVTSAMIGPGS